MASICYFIKCNDLIKIGVSRQWKVRLAYYVKQYERIEVIGTIPGGPVREKSLHRQFAQHRVGGEWFRDNPEIRAAIKDILDHPPPIIERLQRARVVVSPHDATPRALSKQEQRIADLTRPKGEFFLFMDERAAEITALSSPLRVMLRERVALAGALMLGAASTAMDRSDADHDEEARRIHEEFGRLRQLTENLIVCQQEQTRREVSM